MSTLLRWLSRDELPLEIIADGAYPLPILRRFPGHTIVGAFNLTIDPWSRVTFNLTGPAPARVDRLTPAGEWVAAEVVVAAEGKHCSITLETSVSVERPLVLDIAW